MELAVPALRLFCTAYLIRWFSITSQIFLSAIEKPIHATILSVSTALLFPASVLAILWNMGLDGIWLNTLGTSALAAILSVVLILHIQKGLVKSKEKERQ